MRDTAEAKQAVTIDIAAMKGALKPIGGSQSDDWNEVIATQAINSIWKSADPQVPENQFNAVVTGLVHIKPNDELEGMLVPSSSPPTTLQWSATDAP